MCCRPLFALITGCLSAVGYAQFADDFTDGDFASSPTWEGDASVFMVNAAQQLQLNNTVAGTSQLRSANAMSALAATEWRVRVKQNFSGSSSNFGCVYLVSDQADLTGPLNGYFLQFGESGSADAIELREQTGTTSVLVCRGTEGQIANSFDVGVQVKRDATGAWQLLVDPTGGTNYALQSSGIATTHTSSAYLGVRCTYTVSNANKFFYDDLYAGPTIVDTTPPAVQSILAISATQVDVRFTEPVTTTSAENIAAYEILPFISMTGAVLDGADPTLVHLGTSPLTSGNTYSLLVAGVQDLAGNTLTSSGPHNFMFVVPATAVRRDVVINEIMADPSPAVGLPEAEFLELHNTTIDRVFDLVNWTISDGGPAAVLPSYTLGPGAYVVVMATASLPLFPTLENKIGVAGFPALNNDGDPLSLRDASSVEVDQVTYALSWYQDGVKDDGGWTLEQIDPTTPCSGAANWRGSNATTGGTPGIQNSIYAIVPDLTPPTLISVQVPNANTLELSFSEALDAGSIALGTYTISPSIPIGAASALGTSGITLPLLTPLSAGAIHTIVVEGLTDCPGNPIGSGNAASFALPEPVTAGDVVINEVLYDPIGTGSDFVELYNRSNKVLGLSELRLANVTAGVVGAESPITNTAMLLLPGEYVLLCEDASDVVANYPHSRTDRFVVMDLPSYNNGLGSVILQNAAGELLDRFDYNDDLHFELVNNPEGYSLERVSPERPTSDNSNWQTAADVAGRATPGFLNSQYAPLPTTSGELSIAPNIFSPDNDGHQDVLNIAYAFNEPGYVGSMVVYDLAGREVRWLMNNLLLGTDGVLSWDGLVDGGGLARMGPYVVALEAYDPSGEVHRFKRTVTLAHRLD